MHGGPLNNANGQKNHIKWQAMSLFLKGEEWGRLVWWRALTPETTRLHSNTFSLLLLSLSVLFDCLQPCGLQHATSSCPSLSPGVFSNSCPSAMPSNHLILCHPLLFLPSILPGIRVFSSESALLIRWPKYWRFSFSISLSKEYSGLISFGIDQLDLFDVEGTLRSLILLTLKIIQLFQDIRETRTSTWGLQSVIFCPH